MLVQGFHSSNEADPGSGSELQILCAESDKPHMCTSQTLFQQFLEEAGPIPFQSISFKHCTYTVQPYSPAVSVLLDEVGGERFEITHRNPTCRKAGTVPFGLKRPRKRKAVASTRKGPKPKKQRQSSSTAPPAQASDHKASSTSSSSSESSSESDSSSSSSHESEDEEAEIPLRTEEEKKEERETNAIVEEHYQQKEEAPAPTDKKPASAGPGKGKTYCNQEIGVTDVGLQLANRLAKCRHCLEPISKQTTRIAYAFSRVKFAAWIHCKCFPSYLQLEHGDFQQAVGFLSSWQDRNAGHAAFLDITEVLRALREKPLGSSEVQNANANPNLSGSSSSSRASRA